MANKGYAAMVKDLETKGVEGTLKKKPKETKKSDIIVASAGQDPNDPNVLRGDKAGVWKGKQKPQRATWVTELIEGIKNLANKRNREAK